MSLADRARAALAATARAPAFAGDFAEDEAHLIAAAPAAVLVALTDRPAPGVILTLRPEHLRRHAGQVAFPGGRVDPEDDGVVAAALREAEEEIALPPDRVDLVGTAEPYRTGTGFSVVPVIGVVPPDLAYVPDPAEVAAVFEVPLGFLFDSANHVPRSGEWRGRTRHYVEMLWDEHRIWGATAAMIVNLSYRLGAVA